MHYIKYLGLVAAFVFALGAYSMPRYFVFVRADLWEPPNGPCGSSQPIVVRVTNLSLRRLARSDLDIEMWHNGTSENVLWSHGGYASTKFERIVRPMTSEVVCFGDGIFDDLRGKALNETPQEMIARANDFMRAYMAELDHMTLSVDVRGLDFR